MPDWKPEIRRRLAGLKLEPVREAAIVEELSQHLDDCYEELLAGGATEEEASRGALAELSESEILARELRRVERQVAPEPIVLGTNWRTNMIADLWQDSRYGARMLMKQPGFTLIAVLTLALGIGANTAIFSLVNTVLLRPLPVARPERVVEITPLRKGADAGAISYPFYKDFRDQNGALEGLAAYKFVPMSLSQGGNNERLWGYLVSGNYFDLLGVRAARGRMFTQEEDRAPGAHPVAVLSHGCWQRRFGGDPNLVGSTVTINNHSFTVVGIAPPEFNGTVLIFTPEIYVPINMAKQIEPGSNWLESRGSRMLMTLGRLKPDVTVTQAKASLDALAARFGREYPGYEDIRFNISPPGLIVPMLRNATLGFAGVLLAVVALVLLIACVNLANLLLARASRRRKEIAVRLSLGASRFRLIRQLLTESLMLAAAGGALGLLLAWWLVEMVKAFKPPVDFALTIDLKIDWRVLVFTALVSLVTGALFGLIPAWQATKSDLTSALKDETGGGGYRRSRLRNALVVAQVALSLVLLVAAGLIVRSLRQVQTVGPGFEIERTVTASVDLDLQGYDRARGLQFYKQLIARIEAQPGVRAASYIGHLPLNLNRSSSAIYADGQPFTRRADLPEILTNAVWPRYFETMGIGLLEGRDFTMQDDKEEARPVIVNESFARRFWPGQSAVGKRLSQGGPDRPFWEIVGVVKDSRYWSIGEDPQPFVYFPMPRNYEGDAALVTRTTGDPQSLINAIRHEARSLDANLPVYDAKTMNEHMRLSLFPLRTGAWVAGGFAALALLLAGLGIYGVMSYAVSQRTRELGIRMALGARGGDVLRLVIRQGMTLALIGLAIGLAGALALTRLMTSLLVGVGATDAVTFISVTLLLAVIVLIACYIPARRAAKVDPMIALRCE
ncbi:MAG: ADOP family duplicated permease [Blastocatellia bacterium]